MGDEKEEIRLTTDPQRYTQILLMRDVVTTREHIINRCVIK